MISISILQSERFSKNLLDYHFVVMLFVSLLI